MKIGIACGGTGGHIFPGLAVGEVLRRNGHEVILWLAGKPGEDQALAGWQGTVVTVYARGLSSHAPRAMIAAGLRLLRAVFECHRSLRRFKPDVLLAMGSYASVGPVIAARLLHIPVVLHEANVIPGRAIRFLGRWAGVVAVAFEETRRHLVHPRLVVTGMPVRQHVEREAWSVERGNADDGRLKADAGCPASQSAGQAPDLSRRRQGASTDKEDEGRITDGRVLTKDVGSQSEITNQKTQIDNWNGLIPGRFTLLVMGGSRGAHRLNEVVSMAVVRLYQAGQPIQALHLAGQSDEASIRKQYSLAGVPHAVFGFLHDMPRAYHAAALAVCRSGASTCAELSFYGVPALLVPYPFAVHQHQAANADAVAASGAADLCDEQLLTVDWLAGYLADLMANKARLDRMRSAALRRFQHNPALALAELVEQAGEPDDRCRTPEASPDQKDAGLPA